MKRLLIVLAILFLAATAQAQPDNFFVNALTGGTTGCLDAIDVTNDSIDNADAAYVKTTSVVYLYHFNSTSGAAESSPDVIKPDNDGGAAYAGNGRWILIGIYAATAQLANGGQINEFSTDGTMGGNSDSAVPTEKAVVTYVPTIIAADLPGYLIRTTTAYSDADTITLTPAVYHHQGTTEQMVYWDSTLTFDFGSGGSNATSDDLGASEWHHVYLDDSAIVTAGTAVISNSELLNDTTAPSWSDAKHGLYNGDDRYIFSVLTDGSNNVVEFYQINNYVAFADEVTDRSAADLDTTWTDVTLTVPLKTRTQVAFAADAPTQSSNTGVMYWRTDGQTGTTGHLVGIAQLTAGSDNIQTAVVDTVIPALNAGAYKIEVKCSVSDTHRLAVYTQGWYLPDGA